MNLSEHFTLNEMTRSTAAIRMGIANNPQPADIQCLTDLCIHILEPLRSYFQKPIIIDSGYRSMKLNSTIGGAENSQHLRGQAADIRISGVSNDLLWQYIVDNLPFDQVIAEHLHANDGGAGWVHVSFSAAHRKSAISCVHGAYSEELHYEA